MFNRLTVGSAAVAFCGFVLGCSADPGTGDASHQGPAEEAHVHGEANVHSHADEGPHGGHLIVLGDEEYHAELLHDEGTHTVTVHLLDADGNTPVSADQDELTLQLFQDGQFVDYTLNASGSEPQAVEFSLIDETLCHALLHAEEVRGRLKVTIAGKQLTGIIEHRDHEGHAHDDDQDQHDHPEGDHDGHEHE